ncbi:MAG TPA: hypothetical protein VHB21_16885 [Minicystis sp.]|nr:hypothetical protein [Minicystis sp.]
MARSTKAVKRAETAAAVRLVEPTDAGGAAAAAAPREGLSLARVVAFDGARAKVEIAGEARDALVDRAVHPAVVAGAFERGERVLVEVDARGVPTVVGALRTRPTPGLEAAEEFVIQAKRLVLRGDEVSLATAAAAVVLRAAGEVETYAERIVSRAEGLHKIVGRMLRLN